jgi:hypothetical protein
MNASARQAFPAASGIARAFQSMTRASPSVVHLERCAIFRARAAVIVDARGRDAGVVSSVGASSSLRAWWSPIAGALPSPLSDLGRSTPLTGLWVTAFFSHRYSNSEASDAAFCLFPPCREASS